MMTSNAATISTWSFKARDKNIGLKADLVIQSRQIRLTCISTNYLDLTVN